MCHFVVNVSNVSSKNDKSLQEPVRVIAIFIVCLILLVGISSIVHGGDLETSIVGILINISITFVLFYGAKTRSISHLRNWLILSLMQISGLVIGIAYFAYESEQLRETYKTRKSNGSFNNETMENILKLKMTYIIYSIVFAVLAVFVTLVFIIVKKFYDELQRNRKNLMEAYQSTKVSGAAVTCSVPAETVQQMLQEPHISTHSSLQSISIISGESPCSSISGEGSRHSTELCSDDESNNIAARNYNNFFDEAVQKGSGPG